METTFGKIVETKLIKDSNKNDNSLTKNRVHNMSGKNLNSSSISITNPLFNRTLRTSQRMCSESPRRRECHNIGNEYKPMQFVINDLNESKANTNNRFQSCYSQNQNQIQKRTSQKLLEWL